MNDVHLIELDQTTVAIELMVENELRVLRGMAHYGEDAQFGPVLRILVDEPTGEFELLVRADLWNGSILSGHAYGCAYALRLTFPRVAA